MSYDKTYARDVLGADCTNCPLRTSGKFVPSSGPARSKVAFIGEAPATAEVREVGGVPFTGPAGRLLDIVTSKHGLKRAENFYTNACLCQAPDHKTPAKAAQVACRPRLHKELQQHGVDTVVALGNTAALSVLGVEGVTSLRVGPGRNSPFEGLEGVRVITTIHPAACLRVSDHFPSLVTDVGKVVTESVIWTEPAYTVLDDPDEAISYLHEVERRAGVLVTDIEVDIEKDTGFDHPDRYGLLSVGLCNEPRRAVVIGERALGDERVLNAMDSAFAASKLVCHNGKFDLAGLFPKLGAQTLYFDTMLASYCCDERPGIHGLKHLAAEYLGAPKYDDEIKRYVGPGIGYGAIPRDLLYRYNAYDVVCTYALYEMFERKLDALNLRGLHDFLVEASNELMYLELNGLPVDRVYLRELTQKYIAKLKGIEGEIDDILLKAGYHAINPRSPQQVKAALFHLRVKVVSTDKETLQKLVDHPKIAEETALWDFCSTLLRHRREAKLFGTYVKGPAKRLYKGRVYSTYMLHGTTSGRLASRNPNLQNIVRDTDIKRLYIPGRLENLFIQADYKSAELRILTWLAQDEFFREILNDPTRDLFDELTPRLFPRLPSKEEYLATLGKDKWSDVRVRVKAFVYGLGYGRTEYSIAGEYKMPLSEAKVAKENFFDTIPAVVKWQKNIQAQVRRGEDLITPFGRHRRFHLITEENWDDIKKEALAFKPQSTSSDVCLRALVRVRRDLRGSGAYIRNTVHDSILVDSPPDMVHDVATLLDRRMVESAQELVGDYVNFYTDVKIGKNWSEV